MVTYIKKHWEGLLISIMIPELVGLVSSLLSGNVKLIYQQLVKPPLSPPGWVFGVVWPILYMMMGIASYLIYEETSKREPRSAINYYIMQLSVNFLWSIVFFRFGLLWIGAFIIIILDILVIKTILSFKQVSRFAAYLLLPYLIWILYATYLNVGIALLN